MTYFLHRSPRIVAVVAIFLATATLAQSANSHHGYIYGNIADPSGAVISGASITLISPVCRAATTSATDGHFEIAGVPCSEGVLAVNAAGFATYRQPWTAATPSPITIILDVASVAHNVTVTATRTQLPI